VGTSTGKPSLSDSVEASRPHLLRVSSTSRCGTRIFEPFAGKNSFRFSGRLIDGGSNACEIGSNFSSELSPEFDFPLEKGINVGTTAYCEGSPALLGPTASIYFLSAN